MNEIQVNPLKTHFAYEDVVISGISGRFPESDDINEFAENLYSNKDMITEDERRWPFDLNSLPNRMGKIRSIKAFDAQFFGLPKDMADSIDPQSRLLIETTFEAIFDAGMDPSTLRKSNTGVYIGFTTIATAEGIPQTYAESTQNALLMSGSAKSLYANRINYLFDFRGPSTIMDTACASSMSALTQAWNDIRSGACDQAVVGGVNLCFGPFSNSLIRDVGSASLDGHSRPFDNKANGYVRSEACVTVFLQKRSDAKRVYAEILGIQSNTDGFKKPGIFFPSSEMQSKLMAKVCRDSGVNPLSVNYFEAHGTSTKAGDPQEARAIAQVYCNDSRSEPLLIGSVKSNVGHTEGASGLVSIVKVLLAFERRLIAANLNFDEPNDEIKDLIPSKVKVITKNTRLIGDIVGVNSYGIGGVNVNLLLKSNINQSLSNTEDEEDLPLLVCFCGRTQEWVEYILNFIDKNPEKCDSHFRALMNGVIHYKPTSSSSGFIYRGFIVKNSMKSILKFPKVQKISRISDTKPVCFIFPGFGCQWTAMAKSLMPLKIFSQTIEELALILIEFNIDLKKIILSEDENALNSITKVFVGITAIQIALVNILNNINIKPDIIVGHSFGEIACAYADECLTAREAILCSLFRGIAIEKSPIASGLMIAVSLPYEVALKKCQKYNVYIACYNFEDSFTISGLRDQILDLEQELINENIFVRRVRGVSVPFHTYYMNSAKDLQFNELQNIIKSPKKRNLNRWISTSVIDNESSIYASSEYFVNNLISPVLFKQVLEKIPKDSILIEIAPHSLFESGFKRSFGPKLSYFKLLTRDNNENNLKNIFSTIGELYVNGLSPKIENLYKKVKYPVARGTASLGALLKWKHDFEYNVRLYPDYYNYATASHYIYNIQLGSNSRWNFLKDHVIDGTVLFPATGYLILVWQSFAANKHIPWMKLPIHFTNIEIIKGSIISEEYSTKFIVNINKTSGHFDIKVGANIVCKGLVSVPNPPVLKMIKSHKSLISESNDSLMRIGSKDWYKTIRVHGYDYENKFKGMFDCTEDGSEMIVNWTGELISFFDSIIQLITITKELKTATILVPNFFESFKCDPNILFGQIDNELKFKQELAEENVSTKTDIKFNIFYNKNLNAIYSEFIEIRGFRTTPLNRKVVTQGLCLEKYLFIPNNESQAIEENYKKQILEYEEVCNYMLKTVSDTFGIDLNKFLQINYELNGLSQSLIKDYINRSETDENYSLLRLFNDLLNQEFNEEYSELNISDAIINSLARHGIKLSYDLLNNTYAVERLLQTQLDIVLENTVLDTLKILEYNNSTNKPLEEFISKWFSNSPLNKLEIDYNLSQIEMNLELPQNTINDYLVIYNCLDLTNYLNSTEILKLIYDSVVENGFVLLIIRIKYTISQQFINKVLYSSESKNIYSEEDVKIVCNEIGFKTISIKSDSIRFTSILLRKPLKRLAQNQTIIEVCVQNFDEWIEVLKTKINDNKHKALGENIWLYANDTYFNGIIGFVNCLRKESGGERIRCLFDMDSTLPKTMDFNDKSFKDLIEMDLVFNVRNNERLGTFRHLRLEEKILSPFVESKHSYVNCLKRGDVNTLRWFESAVHQSLESSEPNQVMIDVYYAGLNDRDVDYVYNRSIIDSDLADNECLVGQEFSGVRKDNKQRVMGLRFSEAIATDMVTDSVLVFDLPNNWTLEEAATVPLSYFTCYYSLIIRCELQENEIVFIDSADSCLGQAAIAICLAMNCSVFGCVDNETQQQILLNKFENKLIKQNIFIANDFEYKDKLMIETNGKGVDVVLNTRRYDSLDSSLKCIKSFGRFLDLNHENVIENKSLPLIELRRSIVYIPINIDYILKYMAFDNKSNQILNNQMKQIHNIMSIGLRDGVIIPFSALVYGHNDIEEAFRSYSSTKNISNTLSKIVIKIREEFVVSKNELTIMSSPRVWFKPNMVYIITGGLGGFGFQLAFWMIIRGARKLVLTSRTGLKNRSQELFMKRFERIGASVLISNRELKSREDAELLITESEMNGSIGGIFHLAVVLKDKVFENQSAISFKQVFDIKFKGLKFLDQITRASYKDMEYFVVFSSISCGRGNGGQSNYGFANSSAERLCEDRRRHGFHGLAIQWGPIDDIGLVADKKIKISGLLPQRMPTCFVVLDMFLRLPYPVVSSLTIDGNKSRTVSSRNSLVEYFAAFLGADHKLLSDSTTLEDMGVDSLLSVELQKRLERDYEKSIPLSRIKNITIGQLRRAETQRLDLNEIFSNN